MLRNAIFLLIGGFMAGYVYATISTGAVKIRGYVLADRRERPYYYWLCVVVFAAGALIAAAQVLYPRR